MSARRPRGERGSAVVTVLALLAMIGGLSAVALNLVFQRTRLYAETDGELRAQRAAEAGLFRVQACLQATWNGAAGEFDGRLAACAGELSAIEVGHRSYDVTVERVGTALPATLRATARESE